MYIHTCAPTRKQKALQFIQGVCALCESLNKRQLEMS